MRNSSFDEPPTVTESRRGGQSSDDKVPNWREERNQSGIFTNSQATHGVSHRGPDLTEFPGERRDLDEREIEKKLVSKRRKALE
jgi:hypothetical protein